MKKTLLNLFTILTLTLVNAQDFTTADGVTYAVSTVDVANCTLKNGTALSGDIVLPASVSDGSTSYLITEIGNNAFKNGTSLTSLDLSSTQITTIGANAFENCTLTSIVFPNTITLFKNVSFRNSGLTSVTFPSSVTNMSFNQNSFQNCASLQTITFPVGMTAVGDQATSRWQTFMGATSLTTVVNFGSVQTVGNGIFQGCTLLTNIDISGLTYINANAFNGCAALTAVSINSNLTGIGKQAFMGTGISSIILPSTITAIDIDAFKDCVSLKNVQVDHAAPLALTDEVFSGTTDPSTATLHVPTGTTTAYQSADKWSAFGTIVEGTLSAESFNQELNWSFYPNPTSNVVIIKNTQEIILDITVYDVNGRALLSTTNPQVDISNLTTGVYVFKVKTENNEFTKRVIKK
ncbi:MAG: leucine-rich repeat protein [Lutibacter sp.]|nr:leucine-rich repeat protein [Lutibacter sp.]MBP9600714.1 leucine-rich repeat protein [Lutibacter sp.]